MENTLFLLRISFILHWLGKKFKAWIVKISICRKKILLKVVS